MIIGKCKDCIHYRKGYLLCKLRQTQIMDGPIFCINFKRKFIKWLGLIKKERKKK